MKDYGNSLSSKLASLPRYLRTHGFLSGIILSIIVGLGAGFGAIVFRWLIKSLGDVMTRDFPTVSSRMRVSEVVDKLNETGHHGLPVVDENGHLYGMVTLTDVESRITGDIKQLTAADIATRKLITAYPDQLLSELVEHLGMGTSEVPRIPVVSRQDRTRLLGVLRRQDIIKGYAKTVAEIHRSENENLGY